MASDYGSENATSQVPVSSLRARHRFKGLHFGVRLFHVKTGFCCDFAAIDTVMPGLAVANRFCTPLKYLRAIDMLLDEQAAHERLSSICICWSRAQRRHWRKTVLPGQAGQFEDVRSLYACAPLYRSYAGSIVVRGVGALTGARS